MTTRADLQKLLRDPQIKAFLRVIREGESNQNDDAYSIINGGAHFTSFAAHPYAGLSTLPPENGKAAGAYQFIPHTWEGLAATYGFTWFTPPEQDEGAVGLIVEHDAVSAIQAGDVEQACVLLKSTWVSLPPRGLSNAKQVFVQYGGTLTGETVAVQPQQPEKPVGALSLLPMILQLIPTLLHIPGLATIANAIPTVGAAGGSPHASDYLPLAQTIVDVFTKAVPGAQNPAMAVGMAQADLQVQTKAANAVLTNADVIQQLNDLAPILDKVHQYDKDVWAAQLASRDAAAVRSLKERWDMTPWLVWFVGTTSTIVAVGLIVTVIYQSVAPASKGIDPALLGLAGPLLMGIVMTPWREIFAYRFDGTPTSNATALVNQQLAAKE